MQRVLPIAALVAAIGLFVVPAQAQMGATGGGMTNRGAAPLGAMPPADRTNQGNMQGSMGTRGNAGDSMGGQGNMGMRDGDQGSTAGRMMRNDAGERQITECLNMAAAQQRPLSSCSSMR